jgi:hypothetical protein
MRLVNRTNYSQWLQQVETIIRRACGVDLYDLGDWCFADMYDAGRSPQQAAESTMAQYDFPSDLQHLLQ